MSNFLPIILYKNRILNEDISYKNNNDRKFILFLY